MVLLLNTENFKIKINNYYNECVIKNYNDGRY